MEALRPVSCAEIAVAAAQPLELTGPDEPALRMRARPFAPEALGSPELVTLVSRMWQALDPIRIGVGLAAPQVGLSYALFLVNDKRGHRFALANPARRLIVPLPALELAYEGCLSWPGWEGRVARPEAIRMTGYLVGEGPVELELGGFPARILSHEMDHLEGRLYLDRALPGSLMPDRPLAVLR